MRIRPAELDHLHVDAIGRPRTMLLSPELDKRGRPTGYLIDTVTTLEAYREFARRQARMQSGAQELTVSPDVQPAYVSDGRWVIDCPNCRSGAAADPEWGIAICCQCGTEYRVEFPSDWVEVETVLLERPSQHQRHHFPHADVARRFGLLQRERLIDLKAENLQHGHGLGQGRR